jgi:hypothetical protein
MAHPDWISTNQVAELLGIRRQQVRRVAIAEGIRAKKLPGCARRYYRADALAVLRRSVTGGPVPEPARSQ